MITGVLDSSMSKVSSTSRSSIVLVYAVFVTVAVLIYHWIAEGEFSAILTLSAIFQCLAFCLLGVQALSTGSAHGISAKSLQLDALALACRLSSTTWLQGYLPYDQTGDYLYQCFDALSLGMVLWLLYHVTSVQRATYDSDEDGLPAMPFAAASLFLAGVLHGDLNDRPMFDTLWMCGLFVSAIAVLPQLWMMTRSRASTPALTSHFVAVMAFARILSGSYMWYAHSEITCEPWISNFNHAGYAILAAHAVHLLLLGDFAYFYGKNLATAGLSAPLELSEAWVV
jgi:ER lumen protein retaining receptor